MIATLKIDELHESTDLSFNKDLMAISCLALLVSPWALAGMVLFALNISFVTVSMLMLSIAILVAALPKSLQLLIPAHKHEMVNSSMVKAI